MEEQTPKKKNSLLHKASLVISTVGNPLITFSVFILFVTLKTMPVSSAILLSLLVIGGVTIPITINNYIKTKKGIYTNYDVSDREQRLGFYRILLMLMTGVTALMFLTNQPKAFCYGSFVFLTMVVISFIINHWLKVSMHTSVSVYLGFALLFINTNAGIAMLLLSILIALSRLVLKRHTVAEVLAGFATGIAFGGLNLYMQLKLS